MGTVLDLTPDMLTALATIGNRSATATELGVNGGVMKRLWEMDFLVMDVEPQPKFKLPPSYSLSVKGHGAAAILNAAPCPVDREAPVARIKRTVAEHYRIPVAEMDSARRARRIARPRQVAMYLAKKLTPKSLPDIGRQFGHRDHTTVIHAVRTVERLMGENHNFKDEVTTLLSGLVSSDPGKTVDKPKTGTFCAESCGA